MDTIVRGIALLLCAALVLPLYGCFGLSAITREVSQAVRRNVFAGSGELQEFDFEVDDYDSVRLSGNMAVRYENAPSGRFTLSIQEDLLRYVDYSVKNDTLIVSFKRTFLTSPGNTPLLTIYCPELKSVDASGGLSIFGADAVETDSLSLDVSGACDIDLELNVKKLRADLSGASSVSLAGTADSASVDISGAGNVDAEELDTLSCDISISGAGSLRISCAERLSASISGAGALYYRGSPTISQRISGAGAIEQIR